MATQQRQRIPHIEWLDLERNGVLNEVAVVKRDKTGNTHFIRVEDLDQIDRKRLITILSGRNAHSFELWDLFAQTTLGNGMNALDYFHQLVKVLAPTGEIYTPNTTRRGYDPQASLTQKPTASRKAKV